MANTKMKVLLMEAVKQNDVEAVRALIKAGADVKAKNAKERTPLMEAVKQNNVEIVRILIEAGANVNERYS